MSDITRVSRREVHRGRVFDLTVDRFRDESRDGAEFDIEIVHHNGGAAILPIEADGTVVLIRQWRYALDRECLEIPAGRIEPGDDPEATAHRELEEEAGLLAGRVERIAEIQVAPGYTTERIFIFEARDLTVVPQQLEEDERVVVVRMSFEDALDRVDSGEIDDAKTIVALLAADRRMQKARRG
ncbi:MAG TPA: NUDIX hydrolase [Blastocatellia bacterium]|nr:NUDIX hydrolase [Blastocatellia bacterium]